jgi:hypothetical protein
MSFRGLKETTKDIDIILKNEKEYKLFCSAVFGAEYWEPIVIILEYKTLSSRMFFIVFNSMLTLLELLELLATMLLDCSLVSVLYIVLSSVFRKL